MSNVEISLSNPVVSEFSRTIERALNERNRYTGSKEKGIHMEGVGQQEEVNQRRKSINQDQGCKRSLSNPEKLEQVSKFQSTIPQRNIKTQQTHQRKCNPNHDLSQKSGRPNIHAVTTSYNRKIRVEASAAEMYIS
ncbi:MAG: hypothetical protein WBX01_09050 [Nitrososphaeraceae archaeon]